MEAVRVWRERGILSSDRSRMRGRGEHRIVRRQDSFDLCYEETAKRCRYEFLMTGSGSSSSPG